MMRTFSPIGCANVMRNVLMKRKPVPELKEDIQRSRMPILVMVGDQDYPAAEASRFVLDHAPFSGLLRTADVRAYAQFGGAGTFQPFSLRFSQRCRGWSLGQMDCGSVASILCFALPWLLVELAKHIGLRKGWLLLPVIMQRMSTADNVVA